MSQYVNRTRSMNDQLHRGATDGSVANARPNTGGADYTHALDRARLLHPALYGVLGDVTDESGWRIEDAMPDAAAREARRRAGIRGY